MTTNRILRKKAVATVMLAGLAHTTESNGEASSGPKADRSAERQQSHGVRKPNPTQPRPTHQR